VTFCEYPASDGRCLSVSTSSPYPKSTEGKLPRRNSHLLIADLLSRLRRPPPSQIPIPPPPFHPRKRLQGRPGLDLGREHLRELAAVGADPAPAADEPNGAEQVAFDHEGVEPRDPAIGVDLVEHQGVLNGRARVHAPNLTEPRPLPTRLGFAECPATAGPMRLQDSG
jgi:hypothetical protein